MVPVAPNCSTAAGFTLLAPGCSRGDFVPLAASSTGSASFLGLAEPAELIEEDELFDLWLFVLDVVPDNDDSSDLRERLSLNEAEEEEASDLSLSFLSFFLDDWFLLLVRRFLNPFIIFGNESFVVGVSVGRVAGRGDLKI